MNLARNRITLAACRAVLGSVTLLAVAVQLSAASHKPNFQPANFFGYFTIVSNTFAALVLLVAAVTSATRSHRLDIVRGATTLYLVIVGAIFCVLLANLESDVLGWVNVVLHYVMPVAVGADWVVDPPHTRISGRDSVAWLTFPLLYVVYTLFRGSIVHWYPYPFLDVDTTGWAMVAVYIAVIFVFTLILAAVVAGIGNALRVQRDRQTKGIS